MRQQRTQSNEAGVVLPIFALIIVILLVFAAFAVDLGMAWSQRRESQTAADAGVMAAATQYLRNTPPDETAIFDFVNDYANANLTGPDLTFDDWIPSQCTDPSRPADYVALGFSGTWDYPGFGGSADVIECISIKQVGNEPAILRVRLPDDQVPTAFARIIGIDAIAVSAFAEAEILYLDEANILPFSLPSNPATQECLGTPPSGLLPDDVAPCTGPTQGNFGMIDSPWFGADEPYGTTGSACPHDPNFKNRTPLNLALGLDHLITTWPDDGTDGDPDDYDGPSPGTNLGNNHPGADSCANSAVGLPPPYVVLTETGNTQTGGEIINDGFLGGPQFGTANAPGRLRQLPAPGDTGEISGANLQGLRLDLHTNSSVMSVDNVGLWEYLDQSEIHQGQSDCATNKFTGLTGRDLTDQMLRCVTVGTDPFTGAVVAGDHAPVFSDTILDSPRFALVPVLNYVAGSQYGSKWWAVMTMQPVYVQTTWYRCGQPTGECLFTPEDFDTYTPPSTSTTPTTTTTTTTSVPPTTTTTVGPQPEDGKSVFFNPGEGTLEPCLVTNAGCIRPNTMEMAGASSVVIQKSWLSDKAQNAIGGDAPYQVYLRR